MFRKEGVTFSCIKKHRVNGSTDGGDWYHDQVRFDAGLVPRGVSHDSAGVVKW